MKSEVFEIDYEPRLAAYEEGLLMDAGAVGGTQFGADVGVLEQHGVVAGLDDFIIAAEVRAIALFGTYMRLQFLAAPQYSLCGGWKWLLKR